MCQWEPERHPIRRRLGNNCLVNEACRAWPVCWAGVRGKRIGLEEACSAVIALAMERTRVHELTSCALARHGGRNCRFAVRPVYAIDGGEAGGGRQEGAAALTLSIGPVDTAPNV